MAAGHGDDQVQAQFVRICICAQISNGLWVELGGGFGHVSAQIINNLFEHFASFIG